MKKLLISIFLILLTASYVFAKSYPRWQNMPIKVFVSETNPKTPLMKKAFSEWENKSHGMVMFQYVTADEINNADIIVTYVKQGPQSGDAVRIGETKCSYNSNGYFNKVRIEITDQKQTDEKFSEGETYKIMLHEIGHSIGLLEHSENFKSIMWPTNRSQAEGISQEEILRLKNIYY